MCSDWAPEMVLRILVAFLFVPVTATDERLQACLDDFVIHKNKIIRTQDSRKMGAKYLTEIDVEARVDCMKWCCETEHCDVFIFEEKKPGSCYLFQCGPSHDFKCKFTTHANYSSAVLTNYNLQNTAALEEQIRRNKQEHELQSLRKMEPQSKEYSYNTRLSAITLITTTSTPLSVSTKSTLTKRPPCSHNQFECRSSDDCIAIYNVCDGIPQCTDGSDEATDLGCPVEKTTIPPLPLPPGPVTISPKPYVSLAQEALRYEQMVHRQREQYPIASYPVGHMHEGIKGWALKPNLHQPGIQELEFNGRIYNSQQQMQLPDEPIGGNGIMGQQLPINYKTSEYQWNNYQVPMYEHNANKINNEATYDVIQAQNAVPSNYEEEQPSRIFNHKGPAGMRFDDVETSNSGYGQELDRGYLSYYPAANPRENWQNDNLAQLVHAPVSTLPPRKERPEEETKKQTTGFTLAPVCDPATKQEETSKPQNNSVKKVEKSELHVKNHLAVIKEKDINVSKQAEAHEKKLVIESDVIANIHTAHELELRKMVSTRHQQEKQEKNAALTEHVSRHATRLEEIKMSRPRGAVISLTIGLTVTVIMAVLIACKLRVVKRRGRGRSHDPYTHDADYLVNGMYL